MSAQSMSCLNQAVGGVRKKNEIAYSGSPLTPVEEIVDKLYAENKGLEATINSWNMQALDFENKIRSHAKNFYDNFCCEKVKPEHRLETLTLKNDDDCFLTRASVSVKLAERYSELVVAIMDVHVIENKGDTDRISNLLKDLNAAEEAAVMKKRSLVVAGDEEAHASVATEATTSKFKRLRRAGGSESVDVSESLSPCVLMEAVSRAATVSRAVPENGTESSSRKTVSGNPGKSASSNIEKISVADATNTAATAAAEAGTSSGVDAGATSGHAGSGTGTGADAGATACSDADVIVQADAVADDDASSESPGPKTTDSNVSDEGAGGGQDSNEEGVDDEEDIRTCASEDDMETDEILPVYPSNDCYANYMKKVAEMSELKGIEKQYNLLSFDDILNNRNGEIAKKNVVHIFELFGQVIVKDLIDDIKKSYRLDANVAALWSFTRTALGCGQEEIVEMKFKDFFRVIRDLAKNACLIRKIPEPLHINGKMKWKRSSVPFTTEENSFNRDMNRRINIFSGRLMKRVVCQYEKLNRDLLLLPDGKLSGCGFVLPENEGDDDHGVCSDESSSPSSNGSGLLTNKRPRNACERIQVSDRFAIEFVKRNTFSSVGFAEFKEMLYQKKERDDPDTWYAEKKRLIAERALQRENKHKDKNKTKEKKRSEQRATESLDPHDERVGMADDISNDEALVLLTPRKAIADSATTTKTSNRTSCFTGEDELQFGSASPSPIAERALSSDEQADAAAFSEDGLNLSLNEISFNAFDDCCLKKTDMAESYGTVKNVLLRIKAKFGIHANIRVKCDTAKNKRIQSTVQYNLALVRLMLTVMKYHHEGTNVMDISELTMTDPLLQEIRFMTHRAVSNIELESSYGNTKGDGYCLVRACTQNGERSRNPNMSMAALKAFDKELPREKLVDTIQTLLDCMKCRDSDVDVVMKAKLENMKYLALNFPSSPNPMNNWGNSQMCRFLDGEVMIFNYDANNTETTVMSDGAKGVWGDLSVLNYGVLDKLFPCAHPPTLTLAELVKVYQGSNNIAFRHAHFCVLENHRDEDTESVISAVQDWVDALINIALSMSEKERLHVRAFADGYTRLGQWDVENSRDTSVSELSNILVDLTQDDEEDAAEDSAVIDKATGKPLCDVQLTNEDLIETVSCFLWCV